MNKFKIGDIVRATSNNYTVTSEERGCVGEVTGTYGSHINIKITEHKENLYVGQKFYELRQEHFELTIHPNNTLKTIEQDGATIVFWEDGTKTVVKRNGEPYDREKAFAMCCAKKLLGSYTSFKEKFGLEGDNEEQEGFVEDLGIEDVKEDDGIHPEVREVMDKYGVELGQELIIVEGDNLFDKGERYRLTKTGYEYNYSYVHEKEDVWRESVGLETYAWCIIISQGKFHKVGEVYKP